MCLVRSYCFEFGKSYILARRRLDWGVSRFSSIPPRKLGHFLSSSLFTGVINHSVPSIWETESVIYIKHNDFFFRRMNAFNVRAPHTSRAVCKSERSVKVMKSNVCITMMKEDYVSKKLCNGIRQCSKWSVELMLAAWLVKAVVLAQREVAFTAICLFVLIIL